MAKTKKNWAKVLRKYSTEALELELWYRKAESPKPAPNFGFGYYRGTDLDPGIGH